MDPLVTTEWLAKHLADPDLRVVDGTWHMPHLKRDPRAEFAAAHVPGAVFFDIDAIADHSTTLPHMLPTAEAVRGRRSARSASATAIAWWSTTCAAS